MKNFQTHLSKALILALFATALLSGCSSNQPAPAPAPVVTEPTAAVSAGAPQNLPPAAQVAPPPSVAHDIAVQSQSHQ